MEQTIKTNKEKFELINQLIIYSIIFLVFLSTLIFYIIPSILDISWKKDILSQEINHYNEINKKWITYDEFQSLKNTLQISDSYTKNILQTMDRDFYSSNFLNNTQDDYLSFLEKLKDSTLKEYNSQEFAQKRSTLQELLPTYSDVSSVSLADVMDDSKFVNNLENLLDRFNLVSNDWINIWNLQAFDDWDTTKKTKNSLLESDIYYFSIPLNLNWTKKDIIDFIHYLENVASIKIDADNIVTYKDNFIDLNTSYDSPLAEIYSIKMPNYIDSDSTTINPQTDTMSFIKNTQWQETYNIDITIRFFVKWLASYKVQEFVKTTNLNYNNLVKNVVKSLKTIDQKNPNLISAFTSLNSLKKYLDSIKADMDDLTKKRAKKENLSEVYNKAYKISASIDNVNSSYLQQSKLLNSLKK